MLLATLIRVGEGVDGGRIAWEMRWINNDPRRRSVSAIFATCCSFQETSLRVNFNNWTPSQFVQIMHHTSQDVTAGHTLLGTNVLLLCAIVTFKECFFITIITHLVFLDESQSWFKTTSVQTYDLLPSLYSLQKNKTGSGFWLSCLWIKQKLGLLCFPCKIKSKLILHYCPVFAKGMAHKATHVTNWDMFFFLWNFLSSFLFLFLILGFLGVVQVLPSIRSSRHIVCCGCWLSVKQYWYYQFPCLS